MLCATPSSAQYRSDADWRQRDNLATSQSAEEGRLNTPPAVKRRSGERPIHRLAQSLIDGTDWDRRDFASIALRELAAEYEQVLQRAEQDTTSGNKRFRWMNAARGQLDELYLMMDDLDFGADFQIFADPPAAVQFVVPPRTALLSSLQASEPTRLETLVINAYCRALGCDPGRWGAPRERKQTGPKTSSNWSMADRMGTTYETDDGLRFMFSNLHNRQDKALVCERIAAELRQLVVFLLSLQQRGLTFDWGSLTASAVGDAILAVYFNRSGDRYEVSMPYLSQAPGLVEATRAWLAARADGRLHNTIIPGADLLLSRLLR